MKILWKVTKNVVKIYLELTVLWWAIVGVSEALTLQRKNPNDSVEELIDKNIDKTIKRYKKMVEMALRIVLGLRPFYFYFSYLYRRDKNISFNEKPFKGGMFYGKMGYIHYERWCG